MSSFRPRSSLPGKNSPQRDVRHNYLPALLLGGLCPHLDRVSLVQRNRREGKNREIVPVSGQRPEGCGGESGCTWRQDRSRAMGRSRSVDRCGVDLLLPFGYSSILSTNETGQAFQRVCLYFDTVLSDTRTRVSCVGGIYENQDSCPLPQPPTCRGS